MPMGGGGGPAEPQRSPSDGGESAGLAGAASGPAHRRYFFSVYSFSQLTSTSLALRFSFSAFSQLPRSLYVAAPFFCSASPWQYWQFLTSKPAALAFFCMSTVAEAGRRAATKPAATTSATSAVLFIGCTPDSNDDPRPSGRAGSRSGPRPGGPAYQ